MTKIALAIVAMLAAGCADTKRGILIMAHGGDADWNEQIERTVAPLQQEHDIEIAFGMADSATLRAAAEKLEARGVRDVAVVRMFISGESFLPETEYILGLRREQPATVLAAHAEHEHHGHQMAPPEPIRSNARFLLSREGVAESPLIDDILVARVQALSTEPSRESVLILAHGPGDDGENQRWLANMQRRMQRIRESGAFRDVRCETLREDWPEKRAEAERRIREYVAESSRTGRVIVIPFRIAGFGPYAEVLNGLDYVSDGRGFCPHPSMTRWIEQTAQACFARR